VIIFYTITSGQTKQKTSFTIRTRRAHPPRHHKTIR
jgi:hypothetical protein